MHVTVYGPYKRKDNRKHIILRFDDGSQGTISYPKWLLALSGRVLDDNETVDHFDRDFTNDSLNNLRVVDRIRHVKEDVKRAKLIKIKCAWCGKGAKKEGRNLRHNSRLGKAGPFCGRVCAGKYGSAVQNGKIKPFEVQGFPKSKYFQRKKI